MDEDLAQRTDAFYRAPVVSVLRNGLGQRQELVLRGLDAALEERHHRWLFAGTVAFVCFRPWLAGAGCQAQALPLIQ